MPLDSEILRGAGPLTVLRLLAQREMYGYELVQTLARRTDGVLAMGQSTLYPMLYSLEAKGLIVGADRTAPSGRRRKYYAVTPKGHAFIKTQSAQWRRLVAAMGQLGLLGRAR